MILDDIKDNLVIPAVCAPMFLVTGPELAAAASCSGLVGGIPRANARTLEEFRVWMASIRRTQQEFVADNPNAKVGPIAVNLPRAIIETSLEENLAVLREFDVDIVISAQGDPTRLVERVHDWGGVVFHDATSIRFAEKAATAGVDGITCIGYGGGGHSGLLNAHVLVSRVREIFGGVIILGGGISTGAGIYAAEALGADLAYLGTRFIPSIESRASQEYKEMIVASDINDLKYAVISGRAPANWLVPSLMAHGFSREELSMVPLGESIELPRGVHPWADVWSAGQGISLINKISSVTEIVGELTQQYEAASGTVSQTILVE